MQQKPQAQREPFFRTLLKALPRLIRNCIYRVHPKLRLLFGKPAHILCYVNNGAMTSHIKRYIEPLMANQQYRFFIEWPDRPQEDDPKNEFQQFIKKHRLPLCEHSARHAWNLIVVADMRTPASFTIRTTPILYVNHGLHIISVDGGERLYCYGDYALDDRGRPRFSKMCEPNQLIVERMKTFDPRFSDVIVHTGFKFAAGIQQAVARRAEYRRLLGVSPDTVLVGFFGTWRENSLFHQLGEGLFGECERLKHKGYQFLFSIHPNEYRQYDPSIKPMGELVEKQRDHGMLVRSPKEDFVPFIAACDIVVSDYSSMAESAILAGRKLIFSPYPDGMVWKYSLTAYARSVLPTLRDVSALESMLDTVFKAPLNPFITLSQSQLIRPDHDQIMAELTQRLIGGKV